MYTICDELLDAVQKRFLEAVEKLLIDFSEKFFAEPTEIRLDRPKTG
jgi:hypothetical protein